MPNVLSRLLPAFACAAALLLASGCAGPAARQPAHPPAPPVTADTPFASLQTIFFAKFPDAVKLVGSDSYLPTTAQAFKDLRDANATAQDDFAAWCTLKSGTLYRNPWRPDSPNDVRAAVKTVQDLIYVTTRRYTDEDETVCQVQGRPYVLHSKQQTLGPVGGAFTRAIAWVSADDLAKFGPLALQAREAEKRQALKKQADEAAAERTKQQAAAASRAALLDRSPKGTQIACGGHQYADQAVTTMMLMCNGLGVFFGDFAQHGWRVVSQRATPQEMNGVTQGAQVDVVFEKVR